jgi:hypothetical protein
MVVLKAQVKFRQGILDQGDWNLINCPSVTAGKIR